MKQKWFRKMLAIMLSTTMMCTAVPAAASVNSEKEQAEVNPNITAEDTSSAIQEAVKKSGTDRAQVSKAPNEDITSEFTDSNFQTIIKEKLGLSENDPITLSRCAEIAELDVSSSACENLNGIQYFINLKFLNASGCTDLKY